VSSGNPIGNVVRRPSVRLSRRHIHRDLAVGSMRRSQRTFRPDSVENRHKCTCLLRI